MEDIKLQQNSELLQELLKLAKEKNVKRVEEDFLERYLIGRSFNVSDALKGVRSYESFVNRRDGCLLKWKKSRIKEIIESEIVDIFNKTGIKNQKVVWVRVDKWDPKNISVDELLEFADLLCELSFFHNKQPVQHFDMILDLKGLSLKHLNGLSTKFAKRMIFYLAECQPMRAQNVYVIRESKLFHLCYSIFKPLLIERVRNLVLVCGENYENLLTNIGYEALPTEYGGKNEILSTKRWLDLVNNNNIIKALEDARYKFY